MKKEEIIKKIETLVTEQGFVYTLVIMLYHDLFHPPEEIVNINWKERLNYNEFSFLVGLMVKNNIDMTIPTEKRIKELIDRAYELFDELHQAYLIPMKSSMQNIFQEPPSPEKVNEGFKTMFQSGEVAVEAIFYGGSGAYDFQYLEFAEKKYQKDVAWIQANKNLDIKKVAEITNKLKKLTEIKVNTLPPEGLNIFDKYCQWILQGFCFFKTDLQDFQEDIVEAFLNTFSTIPGTVNQTYSLPGDYNVIDSHPIILLKSNLYFLPLIFNLAQSLYESPFYWMVQDKTYKDYSFIHRGEATVDMAFDLLARVFDAQNIYKEAKVYKGNTVITDIDILGIAGNKAVIVQAKSKRLTELARKGNEQQLKIDFNKAIQEAYEQGILCRRAILDRDVTLFLDDKSKINLDESIDDVYIICLTSDHYPALIFQVNNYLKKSPEDPAPLTLNLFDLDILTFYLKDPFEFLYYLRQRITLSDYFLAEEEMGFLGYHLKQKLFRTPNVSGVYIDQSMGQLIDANYPVMRGQHPKSEATEKLHHKWSNKKFEDIIEQIKETKNPGFTDAIFYLYDIAGSGADELIDAIEKTKQKSMRDGRNHDCSMIFDDGKSGVTFICELINKGQLGKCLLDLSTARKYKTTADIWLGLGSMPNSNKMIDAVVFNKQPWSPSHKLEVFSKIMLKPGTFVIPKRKIGRNDPCYCGSGRKFKKCCGS